MPYPNSITPGRGRQRHAPQSTQAIRKPHLIGGICCTMGAAQATTDDQRDSPTPNRGTTAQALGGAASALFVGEEDSRVASNPLRGVRRGVEADRAVGSGAQGVRS